MENVNSYPHLDLMEENGITVTDLPEKTQKLIAKFQAETDEDKKEALDEKIFGDVDDYVDGVNKKKKEDESKAKREAMKVAAKNKKTDVSNVKTDESKEEKGFLSKFLGGK